MIWWVICIAKSAKHGTILFTWKAMPRIWNPFNTRQPVKRLKRRLKLSANSVQKLFWLSTQNTRKPCAIAGAMPSATFLLRLRHQVKQDSFVIKLVRLVLKTIKTSTRMAVTQTFPPPLSNQIWKICQIFWHFFNLIYGYQWIHPIFARHWKGFFFLSKPGTYWPQNKSWWIINIQRLLMFSLK